MYCAECGAEINDKAAVCLKCGAAVSGKRLNTASNVAVPNHMVGAILTTVFCCLVGGVIAMVYASKVDTKLALGDIAGAQAASKAAKRWINASVILGFLNALIYFVIMGAAFAGADV